MKRNRLAAFIIVCLVIGGSIYWLDSSDKFTSEEWATAPGQRVEIVDDLLSNYQLIGMSKQEVLDLLGQPTKNAHGQELNNIVYYLGDERSLISIDSEWLVIWFDRNKVIHYQIQRD